ncbi:rab-GTPase-TBC domain-containing protein [Boeremia exigua]|uniref:rab-GTPase-TBC domain-containing protein n=1 Tax=Boeremia exigua TaxID=749465 RepID=UPI001E8E8A2A|nr:rab-GTPase-TBC domain-containing protein [Boeremia exigua]KAH6629444.1 rab-GTPase-TBC domain-containing protein [Boeremia exigua]
MASRSPSPSALSPALEAKRALVATACAARDVAALVELAASTHGLLSDSLRRTAWPLLLGCADAQPPETPWQDLAAHAEEAQVDLDVNRAFVYYPPDSKPELARRKQELSAVILDVLRRHPALSYFQGYHDIVQVVYLVLGPRAAAPAAARLSLLRIRDFMLSSIEPAIAQLELLRPLLRAADPELYAHLPESSATFALAGTITMFAHNIQEYRDITRLFDFFLTQHTVMPLYFFAAVALSRRDELLDIPHEDDDILHVMLSKLPDPFDIEFHIARAKELYAALPPDSLASWEWWRISSSSVLKTSATLADIQRLTLEDGERYFAQQEKEVRRQQYQKNLRRQVTKSIKHARLRVWYYRRYGAVGLAVLVGAYALWLGKDLNPDTSKPPLFGYLSRIVQRFVAN